MGFSKKTGVFMGSIGKKPCVYIIEIICTREMSHSRHASE